jgi:hypothetical protein
LLIYYYSAFYYFNIQQVEDTLLINEDKDKDKDEDEDSSEYIQSEEN